MNEDEFDLSEFTVPDQLGEVLGWRAWRVIGSAQLPVLGSVTYRSRTWHPGHWTKATCGGGHVCRKDGVQVPGESCSCGLYAAASREQLQKLSYSQYDQTHPVFIGQVAFAGKVIPGSQGWRAEKGRVSRLYVPYEFWQYVDGLQELYRVPVDLEKTYPTGRSY